MKTTAAAFFLLICFGFPATASEYRWIGQITEDGAALSYAIPESDAIKLDFHCDRKTKKIVVNYAHEPKGAKDGMRLAVRLSVRGQKGDGGIEIPMKGERLELDDTFLLQGEIPMSLRLRQILASEGVLLLATNGYTEEIALKGISQAARQLRSSCP